MSRSSSNSSRCSLISADFYNTDEYSSSNDDDDDEEEDDDDDEEEEDDADKEASVEQEKKNGVDPKSQSPSLGNFRNSEPCYEDFMPDPETKPASSQAEAGIEESPAQTTGSKEPLLSRESVTEILAEALYRAGQRSEKPPAPPPTDDQSEPAAESRPAGKRKPEKAGIAKKTIGSLKLTGAQAKKRLATFQKLQKQLAGQVEELLNQLD